MTALIIGIFTGALGVGYIVYGRRQTKYAPLLCGLGLCVYPYFVQGWAWLCVVGVVLAALPFAVDF
jgi:hypothetical protein